MFSPATKTTPAAWDESEVGANVVGVGEAGGVCDGEDVGQRGDRAYAVDLAQACGGEGG
jgi:hypothetical protein